MYNPQSAADWLTERLKRPVSRITVHVYIKRGDIPAIDSSRGKMRASWVIQEADLEAFARRAANGLPVPTGGWPQPKKVNGLALSH